MTVWELLATVLGSAGLSAVLVKVLHRDVDQATAERIRAEAKQIASEAASAEVNMLRQVISDIRTSEAETRARNEELEKRIDKLEERERHMLTRAAVHEAWDQLAFAFIASRDASFPAPPPIGPPGIAGSTDPDDS